MSSCDCSSSPFPPGVKIVKSSVAPPSSPPFRTCCFDVSFATVGDMGFVYEYNPNYPMSVEILEESFKENLKDFPIICGRVFMKDNENMDWPYFTTNNEGLLFEISESHQKLNELFSTPSNEFIWNLENLGRKTCAFIPNSVLNNPLASFKITKFACGGIVISFLVFHMCMDATGMKIFMREWAKRYEEIVEKKPLKSLSKDVNFQFNRESIQLVSNKKFTEIEPLKQHKAIELFKNFYHISPNPMDFIKTGKPTDFHREWGEKKTTSRVVNIQGDILEHWKQLIIDYDEKHNNSQNLKKKLTRQEAALAILLPTIAKHRLSLNENKSSEGFEIHLTKDLREECKLECELVGNCLLTTPYTVRKSDSLLEFNFSAFSLDSPSNLQTVVNFIRDYRSSFDYDFTPINELIPMLNNFPTCRSVKRILSPFTTWLSWSPFLERVNFYREHYFKFGPPAFMGRINSFIPVYILCGDRYSKGGAECLTIVENEVAEKCFEEISNNLLEIKKHCEQSNKNKK